MFQESKDGTQVSGLGDPGIKAKGSLGGRGGGRDSGGQMLRVASGLDTPPLKSPRDKQVKRMVANM